MNRLLKVLKISLLTFIILLFSLVVAGWLLQDRITKYALDELSETFDAPMATKDVNFSLITDFPLASIQFEGLWLGAYQWNDNNEIQSIDTLARVNNLFVSVSTPDLFNDIFTIRKVKLEGAFVKYEIDSLGGTNFDFLMSSDTVAVEEETKDGEPLDLTAEGIQLSDVTLIYTDALQGVEAKAYIPEINGAVKLKDPKTYAHFNGNLVISDVYLEDTPADRMEKANMALNLTFKSDTLEIASLELVTEEINISSQGKVILGEQTYADLSTNIKAPSLAKLTKYAPEGMLKENGVSQIAGSLDINTLVQGIVGEEELPHYEVSLKYNQGSFKYENYPLIYNIGIDTKVTNGSENNNTTTSINLSQLKANMSGNQIDLSGNFNNLDKLKYDLVASLNLDLEASKKVIPDTLVQNIGGKINVELTTKGTAPDSITNDFIKSALANTTAQIGFEKFKLKIDEAVNVRKMSGHIKYSERHVELTNLSAYLPDYKVKLVKNSFDLTFKGDPLKPKSLVINVPKFHFATSEGALDGTMSIKKLKHLNFAVTSRLNLDLNKLKRFTSDTLVNDMNGRILASIQSKGKLNIDKMADQDIEKILYDNTNVDLTLERINLDMKDTLMNVKNLSGKIIKKDHSINIDGLKGGYQGISFDINTTVENAFNTALRNQPGILKVDGTYKLGDLDYKILGAFASEDETEDSTPSKEAEKPTNWNYEVTGQAFVKSFKYDDTTVKGIEAIYDINDANQLIKSKVILGQTIYGETATVNNLSTKLEMNMSNNVVRGKLAITDVKYEESIMKDFTALYNVKDTFNTVTIDKLDFMGFGGEIISSIRVHMKPKDEMEIEMKSNIVELDVRRLMKEMKNFDQNEMTYEQLNGLVSSDNLFLRMVMIGDSIVYDDLRMTCDLKFHDGGIYNYIYVQDMAQYLRGQDNLDTMRFKTIDTHMFLFKDAVYVPKTYVVTSAFDVEAMGMQSFGEDFEYHVGVNLFQVLGKNKKFDLEDKGPVKEKNMVRRMIVGKDGSFTNENSNSSKRTLLGNDIRSKEEILKFKFHPHLINFDTNAEGI